MTLPPDRCPLITNPEVSLPLFLLGGRLKPLWIPAGGGWAASWWASELQGPHLFLRTSPPLVLLSTAIPPGKETLPPGPQPCLLASPSQAPSPGGCRVSGSPDAWSVHHCLTSHPAPHPPKKDISFFGPNCTACGILVPRPGTEPTPPELEGRVLATGWPGKSQTSLQVGEK